jgi:hypothetical protein
MTYSPKNAQREDVKNAKAFDGWEGLPTTDFRLRDQAIAANESHLKSKHIDKVLAGHPLRRGYDPHIMIDKTGVAHVIDGHHRVAMHQATGSEVMPSKVWDVRKRGPIPEPAVFTVDVTHTDRTRTPEGRFNEKTYKVDVKATSEDEAHLIAAQMVGARKNDQGQVTGTRIRHVRLSAWKNRTVI